MIRIYIARHGETTWNAEGKIQGRSDPGLTPKGHHQSRVLLEHLRDKPLSKIYTSTLQRSILTAQPISDTLGIPIQRSPELDEIAFGILEGKSLYQLDEVTKKEWERFKRDRFHYRIPGAESYLDVAHRVSPFVERLLQHHEGEEILIVGHRVVNRLLIGMTMNAPLEWVVKIDQPHECLYLIERSDETRLFHYLDGKVQEGILPVREEVIL